MSVDGRMIVSGARVVDPGSSIDSLQDVLIEDGCISAVDKPGSFKDLKDINVIDGAGQVLAPGLVDVHVHLREPGYEWKETIETGLRAAVAGGFTTVCSMPNTKPVNDNAQVTGLILERARAAGTGRVAPIGAITKGSMGEELSLMLEMREAGCVAFSDDGVPVMDANVMRRALEYSSMLGAVLSVHEEDLSLSRGFAMNEGITALRLGLKGFPEAAENVMIARDIELARLTNSRVHFCHVTTARGALLVERAKDDGIPVTAETTPHHLTLSEEACEGFDTNAKVSPPLRLQSDVDGLVQALKRGVIDCVASDHAPHDKDSKQCEFPHAANGMLGFQTSVPLLFARVRSGELSLLRMIESLSTSPARCFGLSPNRIARGAVADLVLLDPEIKFTLTKDDILSKSKNSPFLDMPLQGRAAVTWVGGKIVFDGRANKG